MSEKIYRERDKEILRLIDKELMTMTAVAKIYGISKQRVQQIYHRDKALGKGFQALSS